MTLYCVQVNPTLSLDQAWKKFEKAGFSILYAEEEEALLQFYLEVFDSTTLSKLEGVLGYKKTCFPLIDWQDQWALHADNFYEGHVHFSLTHDKQLKLQPGAGFGDLSHPTTVLMLEFLKTYFKHEVAIDIGCGSGILSVAAAALGALLVYGIDIDPKALCHSKSNAKINQVDSLCHFSLPEAFKLPLQYQSFIIFMNMIQSEQQKAWQNLPALHSCKGLLLVSGICKAEKEDYLKKANQRNWKLIQQKVKEEWVAFCFEI